MEQWTHGGQAHLILRGGFACGMTVLLQLSDTILMTDWSESICLAVLMLSSLRRSSCWTWSSGIMRLPCLLAPASSRCGKEPIGQSTCNSATGADEHCLKRDIG